jgi:hypothetical protein
MILKFGNFGTVDKTAFGYDFYENNKEVVK